MRPKFVSRGSGASNVGKYDSESQVRLRQGDQILQHGAVCFAFGALSPSAVPQPNAQPTISCASFLAHSLTFRPDQVHAAWLLWRAAAVVPAPVKQYVHAEYAKLGYDLKAFSGE